MDVQRRNTSVLIEALDRDWPGALEPMALPHRGGASSRVYRPAVGAHPATRILDDPRSYAQLFVPSARARADRPGGPVTFDAMTSQEMAARYRRSPAIHARAVQPHRRNQSLFYGDDWAAQGASVSPQPARPSPPLFDLAATVGGVVNRLRELVPWRRA